MNISSGKARLAEEIADEVRLGFHIYEIVGRHVEHIVGVPQKVKELRTSPIYAMRAERLDPNEVCNGIEALKGLLAGNPQFPLEESQRAALQVLRDALDTYGDLLMADGVMQLDQPPSRARRRDDGRRRRFRTPAELRDPSAHRLQATSWKAWWWQPCPMYRSTKWRPMGTRSAWPIHRWPPLSKAA